MCNQNGAKAGSTTKYEQIPSYGCRGVVVTKCPSVGERRGTITEWGNYIRNLVKLIAVQEPDDLIVWQIFKEKEMK